MMVIYDAMPLCLSFLLVKVLSQYGSLESSCFYCSLVANVVFTQLSSKKPCDWISTTWIHPQPATDPADRLNFAVSPRLPEIEVQGSDIQ